jgi:hypothetical protein
VSVLYRVLPYVAGADPAGPGGALYLPPQQAGRLDNPDLYSVFYASSAEAGAIAESFGRFAEWTPAILEGSPSLPGSARAVARYRLSDDAGICDLDDPRQLRALGLRPSDVVSRDYARTREWARRIYQRGTWDGVRWWSYYDARWASVGLWRLRPVALEEVRVLRLDDAAMAEAGRVITRRIVGGGRL